MTRAERAKIVAQGLEVLRRIEQRLRARLPPPGVEDDAVLLRRIRDVNVIAVRLEPALSNYPEPEGFGQAEDFYLSGEFEPFDTAIIRSLVVRVPGRPATSGPDAAALEALASLLDRYYAWEFAPKEP